MAGITRCFRVRTAPGTDGPLAAEHHPRLSTKPAAARRSSSFARQAGPARQVMTSGD